MWKLWFHKIKLSNLHKVWEYNKEIGEIINKIGENRKFRIVSIDTESAAVKFECVSNELFFFNILFRVPAYGISSNNV